MTKRAGAPRKNQAHLELRIVVLQPPPDVLFAVQEGQSALLPPTTVAQNHVAFRFGVRVGPRDPGREPNLLGSFAQGPRGGRFVYVNSGKRAGQPDSCWDRRAKVPLGAITWSLIESARARPDGVLEARISGTGRDGGPVCASVKPVNWEVKGE